MREWRVRRRSLPGPANGEAPHFVDVGSYSPCQVRRRRAVLDSEHLGRRRTEYRWRRPPSQEANKPYTIQYTAISFNFGAVPEHMFRPHLVLPKSKNFYAVHAWSTKCRRKKKLIAQLGEKLRDETFEPN